MNNTSTVTSKGQIVIPAALRKKLGLKPGTKVTLLEKEGSIIVNPHNEDYFDRFVGIWGTDDKALKLLLKERKLDAKREEKKALGRVRSR